MKRRQWQQIERIVDKALTFETLEEQEYYISKTCGDNRTLFLETRLLIRSIHDAQRISYLEEEE